jgi:tRNA(fMet)-specific endonuclease VapC
LNKYLLDTDICIYYLNGKYSLNKKFKEVGFQSCNISEITVAELKYGAEKSQRVKENKNVVEEFVSQLEIIPIYTCLDLYAKEKARLKNAGNIIDDFDLLIGTSSIVNDMILVTNNEKHFQSIKNIKIESWTK